MNFRGTPERAMQRKQERERQKQSIADLSMDYAHEAEDLVPSDDLLFTQTLTKHAKGVVEAREGLEQDERIEKFIKELGRWPRVFDVIPDDKRERSAFVYALAKAHLRTIQ